MEKARCNTELYSNLRGPLNNVKPSNFWGSHHADQPLFIYIFLILAQGMIPAGGCCMESSSFILSMYGDICL